MGMLLLTQMVMLANLLLQKCIINSKININSLHTFVLPSYKIMLHCRFCVLLSLAEMRRLACLLLFMLVYTIYVFLLVDAQKQKGSDKGFK